MQWSLRDFVTFPPQKLQGIEAASPPPLPLGHEYTSMLLLVYI